MGSPLSLSFRLGMLAFTLLVWLLLFFGVNRRQVDPLRRVDFRTSFDDKIPFIPEFAWVYFSTYFFVFQPFFILSDAKQFYWMLAGFSSISICASLVHAALPSKICRYENLNTTRMSGKMLHLFQQTCKPYGNFPSMHVGLSVPVVISNYLVVGIGMGTLTLVWAVLIALSTLFTKQHYIIDVLSGLFGGLMVLSFLSIWIHP
ncbi:MAG: phosphatase PAP2 family protein [Anaerolineaceae bacterium]